jgi:hypothetical protein
MSGQAFFLTMSGISLSLAGFAGLLVTFRQPNLAWTRTDVWRVRRIVSRSFVCVFLSLAPIPLFALTGDEAAALRIASLILGAVLVIDLAMLTPSWRRDWPDDPGLYVAWLISGSNALLGFANVVWGSTGIYELALGLALLWPSSIFIRVLRDLSAGTS